MSENTIAKVLKGIGIYQDLCAFMKDMIVISTITTYRITMSIVHFRKSRKKDNSLLFELRMINMKDALVAVLSLQNALIIAIAGIRP